MISLIRSMRRSRNTENSAPSVGASRNCRLMSWEYSRSRIMPGFSVNEYRHTVPRKIYVLLGHGDISGASGVFVEKRSRKRLSAVVHTIDSRHPRKPLNYLVTQATSFRGPGIAVQPCGEPLSIRE